MNRYAYNAVLDDHEEMLAKLRKLIDQWQAASYGNTKDVVEIAVKYTYRECAEALLKAIGRPDRFVEE